MRKLTLNYKGVLNFVSEEETASMSTEALQAANTLRSGNGAGGSYTGWVLYPFSIGEKELDKICEAAREIRLQSNCLVVIGIGGSYLGAKAVIEMLDPPFSRDKHGEIIFIGNNMDGAYLEGALAYLKETDFSVNVISKSGKTLEPALAFRFVKKLLKEKYGKEFYRRVWVTTSEHGLLHEEALKEGYREFYIPDNIGGRYSVLTPVGLLPIAFKGYDIKAVMLGAKECLENVMTTPFDKNDCLQYAVIRNLLYRKKFVNEIFASFEPDLHYLGEWWKQLFGESEGKDGKGIFPVSLTYSTDLHSLGQYVQDGTRNIFETFIAFGKDKSRMKIENDPDCNDGLDYLGGKDFGFVKEKALAGTVKAHIDGGVPVMIIEIEEKTPYLIGYLIYFFMFACGVSGYLLGVNPFDQEGVEAYKRNMFALLKE